MREKIAELCHKQWSGWMFYLFSKCSSNDDGTLTIPAWAVARWTRQMATKYARLSEMEKQSDRGEADRFLKLLDPQNKIQKPVAYREWGIDFEKFSPGARYEVAAGALDSSGPVGPMDEILKVGDTISFYDDYCIEEDSGTIASIQFDEISYMNIVSIVLKSGKSIDVCEEGVFKIA